MTVSKQQARKQNERELRDAIQRELREKMRDITDEIFSDSQRNLVDEDKVDTGNLLRSGRVISDETSDGWPVFRITYNAPYASDVHYGREPGSMPPVGRLAEWVRRNIDLEDDESPREVAFVIAKAIEDRGIEPTPFLENALNARVRGA
jgi:hypothetical protein